MMEYLPGEVYDLIVTHLHSHFCRCTSENSRPSAWESTRHNSTIVWDTETPRWFQGELCRLRLVNKKFLVPATRYIKSHGTFVFGSTYPYNSNIERQVRYCTDEANRSIVAGITGLFIDFVSFGIDRLPQLESSRSEPQQIMEMASSERAEAAKAACKGFRRAIHGLEAPFDSVTALELRFHEGRPAEYILYRGVEWFMQTKLPQVKDLYLRGGQHAICMFLAAMPHRLCNQMRRLLVFYMDEKAAPSPPLVRFTHLTELGIHYNTIRCSLSLPPQPTGLTRLHLCRITTTAAHLISMLTRGPTAPGAADGHAGTGSPLVECVLLDMQLDVIRDGNGLHDAGTWSQVFRHLGDYCPNLTILCVKGHGYGGKDQNHTPSTLEQYYKADRDELKKLVAAVRLRPGGHAT